MSNKHLHKRALNLHSTSKIVFSWLFIWNDRFVYCLANKQTLESKAILLEPHSKGQQMIDQVLSSGNDNQWRKSENLCSIQMKFIWKLLLSLASMTLIANFLVVRHSICKSSCISSISKNVQCICQWLPMICSPL